MSAPRVRRFDHATLVVADLDRTRAFYVDLLGLGEVPRPAFSYAGAWFRAGDVLLHVIAAFDGSDSEPGSGPAGINEDGRAKSTRGPHLAFACDDPAAFEPVLREAGVRLVRPLKHRPDGAAQLFVCDPDGHVVELTGPGKEGGGARADGGG